MTSEKKSSKKVILIGYIIACLLGIIGTSIFWHFRTDNEIKNLSAQIVPQRQSKDPYQFINPLLGYSVPDDFTKLNENKSLEKKVSDALTNSNFSSLDGYSFFYRDLSSRKWAGINQNDQYLPGSMMKTFIMAAYFKEAETNPEVLDQKYIYSSSTVDEINGVPFSSASDLQVGQSYTVEQLIDAMIINSDNGAKDVLINHVNPITFIQVHTDLGLPSPIQYENYTISAEQYSQMLRNLYNSTYLSRGYSEKALTILSQSTYKDGLTADLPAGTIISQKFGEALNSSDSGNAEILLSDCGIVYHSATPYILCVMTKGKDTNQQAIAIATISKIAWEDADSPSK